MNGGNVICVGGDVWVMVYLGDEGVIYYWYFIFLGNNLVFVGNIFLFFGIEESDIYYVEVCRGGCILDCILVNV